MVRRKSLTAAPSTWREEFTAMARLAWPLILSNLASIAITTTDVLMLGRLGAEPLAASALAVNLYNLLLFTGVGLVTGAAPLIAAALGRRIGAVRDTRRSFRMGLWLAALYGLAGWLLLWNAEALFLLMGQDPGLSAAAGDFMRILMWALVPGLFVAVFRTLLTAFGRTPTTLIVTLGGVALNALLNWMLIFGRLGAPRLGLEGSAIASLATTCAMAVILAAVILGLPRLRRMRLFGHWWRADWPRLRELVRIGGPIGASWAFEVSVFSCAVYLMGLLDTASVAAHVIALQIASLSFMVPMGLAQGVTIRVGMAYGARNDHWIALAGKVALGLSLGAMTASALVMWIFPRELASLFLDAGKPDSAHVLALAVQFLVIAAVFQLADGAQVVGAAMLRGIQDTRVPMMYAAFGYWIVGLGSGASLAFLTRFRGQGIWIGLALGLLVVAALMLWRWAHRSRLGLTQFGQI